MADIMEIYALHDVVAGPIYTIEDIFADPQYAARNSIITVPDRLLGAVKMPGIVPRFDGSPGVIRRAGGALGEHNEEIFLDEIGIERSYYETLLDEAVI